LWWGLSEIKMKGENRSLLLAFSKYRGHFSYFYLRYFLASDSLLLNHIYGLCFIVCVAECKILQIFCKCIKFQKEKI
jgi:hypothetical protein